MKTVRLISNHPGVMERAAALQRGALRIDSSPLEKISSIVGEMAGLNPDALVLDLDKTPSRGREIAIALRSSRSARHIPILFAGGLPEKIERLRGEIPNVSFASWNDAAEALIRLLKAPATLPSAIPHRDYSATPLSRKLGIRERMRVALIGPFEGFEELLGELPQGVAFANRITAATQLGIVFVRSWEELSGSVDLVAGSLPKGTSIWIVYPKRKLRQASDLNESMVRDAGLGAGLVDYKVCSVSDEWSALKFARRKG